MKRTLVFSILMVAALTGCTNVTPLRHSINGVSLTRVTTRGIFSPSSTVLIASDPKKPGTIEVLAAASGPGVLPAIATAGGVAGGAALLRPSNQNSVNQASGGNGTSSATATGGHSAAAATSNNSNNNSSTGGNFVPPGQVGNPGHNN